MIFSEIRKKELKEITDKLKNEYGITIYPEDYHRHQQLNLKLKLWNEQEGEMSVFRKDDRNYGSAQSSGAV